MKYFEVEYLFKGQRNRKLFRAQNRNDALTMAKISNPGVILKVIESSPPADEQFKIFKERIMAAATGGGIKMPALIAAVRQLAVMTNAGISIHDSIKEVAKATTDKRLQAIFMQADDDLNSGLSLTESLVNHQHHLGDVTLAMVELGESTGNMAESLIKLAEIQQEIWENKQKFKKAIRYPITVMVAIAIAFTILMVYVVPKFKSIFDKFKSELPLPTKILLGMESAINNYGLYILAGLIGLIVLGRYMYANNEGFKNYFDKHVLKVYLIGDIVFFSTLSRFNLVFTELVRAGIPIADALDTALLTIGNTHLKNQLNGVKVSVQRGVSLTEAFRETGLYEGMLIQMISAGEQSGSLDMMLEKVTDYYKSRFNDIIDNIASYIEPILIGVIAGIVLLLALGIFMPMWDLAKAVKG
jgi:general secretion pathway protein F/MSHA biogenesis protein MshG